MNYAIPYHKGDKTQLSKNFKAYEFDCKDSMARITWVNPKLVELLQKLRDKIGPIRISSGYRSPKHNSQVGGVKNSQHLFGNAADLVVPKDKLQILKELAEKELKNSGGIGYYPNRGFVHIDVREGLKARWTDTS